MSQVTFNVKLNVDGKEKIVEVTTDVSKLAGEFEKAKSASTQFRDKLLELNQASQVFQNLASGLRQLKMIFWMMFIFFAILFVPLPEKRHHVYRIFYRSRQSASAVNRTARRVEHETFSSTPSLHGHIRHSTCSSNCFWRYRRVVASRTNPSSIEYDVSACLCSVWRVVLHGHASSTRKNNENIER